LTRHYRRGGLLARWNRDRYRAAPAALTRAMREMTLLREMRSIGLPVPRPIAARCVQRGRTYQADIIVGYLPDTRNVAEWLSERALTADEWRAIGWVIRQMHEHQIYHSDLNCHNILLNGSSGQVWLIDFDKCERRGGDAWKAGNLARLERSLLKEAKIKKRYSKFNGADYSIALRAYHDGI
jgi:3-deoxy-D-manno-octulosonic-acid transferase